MKRLTAGFSNYDAPFKIQRKEMVKMTDFHMPHSGHERHLCFLHNIGLVKDKLEEYKKLVKDGKYVCNGCGGGFTQGAL